MLFASKGSKYPIAICIMSDRDAPRRGALRVPRTRTREGVNKMSVDENLRLVDAAIDAANAHDLDRFVKHYAESVVNYGPGVPEPTKGRTSFRDGAGAYFAAFPDFRFKKERSFGQGDWVCIEFIVTGTHKGPLAAPGGQTIPATNKPIWLRVSQVMKVEAGKFTESHYYFDTLELLSQLGMAP